MLAGLFSRFSDGKKLAPATAITGPVKRDRMPDVDRAIQRFLLAASSDVKLSFTPIVVPPDGKTYFEK